MMVEQSGRRVVLALVAIASLARLISWFLSLPVTLEGDAHSYLPGPDLVIIENPYVGLEKVSMVGDALRPWPITLLFGIFPTMALRSFALLAISVVAFGVLALQAAPFFKTSIFRALAVISIMSISLSPQIGAWDLEMGGESLTISLLIAVAASFIAFVRQPGPLRAVGLLLLSTALMVMRPPSAPLVMFLGLATVWIFVRRVSAPLRNKVMLGIAFAGLFAVAGLYATSTIGKQETAWQRDYGQTQSEAWIGYILSAWNSQQGQLLQELETRLPPCAIAALPVQIDPVSKPWYFAMDLQQSCPELTKYIRDGTWRADYLKFVVTHPDYVFALAKDVVKVNLSPGVFGDYTSPLPQWLTTNFFGTYEEGRLVFDPLGLWVAASIAFFAWLAYRRALTGSSWFFLATTLGALAGLFVWLMASHLVVPAHLMDRWRISIAPAVGTRLLFSLLALALIDRTASLMRRARPEPELRDGENTNTGPLASQ